MSDTVTVPRSPAAADRLGKQARRILTIGCQKSCAFGLHVIAIASHPTRPTDRDRPTYGDIGSAAHERACRGIAARADTLGHDGSGAVATRQDRSAAEGKNLADVVARAARAADPDRRPEGRNLFDGRYREGLGDSGAVVAATPADAVGFQARRVQPERLDLAFVAD
ncbi:hypothetical protein [Roseovarius sp. M141]|uniref:hypothetical protein n=1 Tax=Roseovarius sp. M141 TaxID=2583806 RepID=UPI0020CD7ADE|nr:hypothetical protein [Roseovarius sp. M141]MCQ0093831.1 hypothetical protein [Roseovarius sp. M141]